MSRDHAALLLLLALLSGCMTASTGGEGTTEETTSPAEDITGTPDVAVAVTHLPTPTTAGSDPLVEVLAARRSIRAYSSQPLDRMTLGALLWAAQGTTTVDGRRTAPSAGALYPLEVYAATADGLEHYLPDGHRLARLDDRDHRRRLAQLAAGQEWLADAPVVLVLVGVETRTAAKYGDRAARYVAIEAGHATQNILLRATDLGLGATPVGAFDDAAVAAELGVPPGHAPLLLVPVGHPAPQAEQ